MSRISLGILQLVLLILLPCRLCAARNDPGGSHAGVHLPTWKQCLVVAFPVTAVALLVVAVIVFACRRGNQDAAVAVEPAQDSRKKKKQVDKPDPWAHLWSRTSPRNPMSINPTMVPSPPTMISLWPTNPEPVPPSAHGTSYAAIFGNRRPSSPSRSHRPPAKVASPLRPGPSAQAETPLRPGSPALAPANKEEQAVTIKDPLACYSPAFSAPLAHLAYDLLESAGSNGFKFKRNSQPGGRVGPWNVVLKDIEFVLEKGLPTKVIVKRHYSTFREEDCKRIREELNCKSTLRHKNLVKLHGYTLGKGRLYLVYDYMPNGSLENHLFPTIGVTVLNWLLRYRIAREVAQGLDPLHVSDTPHGSISVSSIMLDRDYVARLDDHFNYRPDINSRTSTMAAIGTSLEADIADLGAVFLELVCGRRRTETISSKNGTTMTLVDWVWALYGEAYKEPGVGDDMLQRRVNGDRLFDAVDPTLKGEIIKAQASTLLILGLACSHPDSKLRPNIREVRMVLLGNSPVPVPQLPLSKPTCK